MKNVDVRKVNINDFSSVKRLMQSVQDLHHNNRSEIHKDSEIFDKEEFSQNINNIIVAEINNLVVGVVKYLIKEKLENSYTNYRSILTKQSSSVYNKLCMKIFANVLRKYSSKSGGKSYETREKTAWQAEDACWLLQTI